MRPSKDMQMILIYFLNIFVYIFGIIQMGLLKLNNVKKCNNISFSLKKYDFNW